MGQQIKRSTSLDSDRAERLLEILEAEPLATPSVVLALGVDLAYQAWLEHGRDLKGLLGGIGARKRPVRPLRSRLAQERMAG